MFAAQKRHRSGTEAASSVGSWQPQWQKTDVDDDVSLTKEILTPIPSVQASVKAGRLVAGCVALSLTVKANVAFPVFIARLPVKSSFGADVTFATTVTGRSGNCLYISGAKTLKKFVLSENGVDAGTMEGVTVYCKNPACWKTERARSPLQAATSAASI